MKQISLPQFDACGTLFLSELNHISSFICGISLFLCDCNLPSLSGKGSRGVAKIQDLTSHSHGKHVSSIDSHVRCLVDGNNL
jgi:hypothetical protein